MKKRLKAWAAGFAAMPPWARRLTFKVLGAAMLASCPFWPWAPAQAFCADVARELGAVVVDFTPDGGTP